MYLRGCVCRLLYISPKIHAVAGIVALVLPRGNKSRMSLNGGKCIFLISGTTYHILQLHALPYAQSSFMPPAPAPAPVPTL